jgi:hypothetical protein
LDDGESAGAQYASNFPHRGRIVGDVLENVVAHHRVDAAVSEWQLGQTRLDIDLAAVSYWVEVEANVGLRAQSPVQR